jgi:hypothetical protein
MNVNRARTNSFFHPKMNSAAGLPRPVAAFHRDTGIENPGHHDQPAEEAEVIDDEMVKWLDHKAHDGKEGGGNDYSIMAGVISFR